MAVWKDKFIRPNKYSRPQTKLTAVRKIVMHWTANYGATANGHYNYFNTLSGRYASAHLFVDKIEALCIVPLNEITYHANDGSYKGIAELRPNANFLSVGIELCVEKDGSFHPDTIKRAKDVAVELCKRYKLDPLTDIVRHYDVTHKSCPTPWIKNESAFNSFKADVKKLMKPVASKPVEKPVAVKPVANAKSHTVVEGETFYSISKKYNMTVEKLQGFNPRVKASDLQVGDVIHLIPVPASAVEKPAVKPVAPKPAPKPVEKPAVKPAPKPTVKKLTYSKPLVKGSKGNDVKALQEALNKLNFKVGVADGSFGAKTEDAVKRFQSVYLANEVDGFAGKATIDKINSLLK